MVLRYAAAMLAVGMATSAPAVVYAAPSGQQASQPLSPGAGGLSPGAPARANPYSRLFPVPGAEPGGRPTPTERRAPTPEPKVVCGMTLIPANPQIDPGIAVAPPRNSPRFTIRAIEPSVCR